MGSLRQSEEVIALDHLSIANKLNVARWNSAFGIQWLPFDGIDRGNMQLAFSICSRGIVDLASFSRGNIWVQSSGKIRKPQRVLFVMAILISIRIWVVEVEIRKLTRQVLSKRSHHVERRRSEVVSPTPVPISTLARLFLQLVSLLESIHCSDLIALTVLAQRQLCFFGIPSHRWRRQDK